MKRSNIFATLLLAALLITVIFGGLMPADAASRKSFPDVGKHYWAADYILSLANYGIINGNADGKFKPTDNLRRSELAKLLTTAFIYSKSPRVPAFSDVEPNHWAAGFISTVIEQDLVDGFPDNTFRPNAIATRVQLAKILVKVKGYSTSNVSAQTFEDVGSGYWGYKYVQTAAKNNLISGYSDGTFRPNAQISRAEAAALIYRALLNKDYLLERSSANQVTCERYRRFIESGPININVLKVPKTAPVSIKLGLAKDRVAARERLSSMAKRKGAIAGVNADFFSVKTGGSSGLMVDDQILSSPINSRSYFGILSDKTCFIDRASMSASVMAATGRPGIIAWLNKYRDRDSDTIYAYTPFYGPSTLTEDTGTEVSIQIDGAVTPSSELTGTVREVNHGGNSLIKPNYIVLSADSGSGRNYLDGSMKIGDTVHLKFYLNPWQSGAAAIGGGPRLVRAGQVNVESEGFDSSQVKGRNPRTGIGIDSQGNLIIEVIDGRSDCFSIGMTLTELAADLKNRGAVDAMNFDSGGSSTLYFNGDVCNYPSDGSERSISNAILFIPN
ncbi:MAG: S-layer homology domain-containing protein [Candidatus Aquicultor sp.]